MKFYKYQRINDYTISGLRDQKLWRADPLSFNDPFELRLMHLEEKEISEVKGLNQIRVEDPRLTSLTDHELFNMVISELQNFFFQLRVISYTEKKDDILMWAHYANNHKGICLGFEVEDMNVAGIYKMNYSDEYPMLDLENILSIKGLAKILINKSTHWSYEKEWRQMFIEPETMLNDYPGKLTEIILGARVVKTDESSIRDIYNQTDVSVKKALLHPQKYELIIE